jgi:site-specific recombinase XerD
MVERDKLQSAQQSPFTTRGYGYNWKHFVAWCDQIGRQSLPATPDTVSLYLTYLLTTGKKVTTASRSAAAVAFMHQDRGYPSPLSKEAKGVLAGARRLRCEQLRQMTPLTVRQMCDIARVLSEEPSTVMVRNKAILLVGFASALRRINLAGLDFDDVTRRDEGVLLRVKREKQDRQCTGRTIAIPLGKEQLYCPVRALDCWLELRGKEPGALFTQLNPWGKTNASNLRLSLQRIWEIVKAAIRRAGIDASGYGPHSLRAGLITSAGLAGVNPLVIAEQSGHKSLDSLKHYYRPTDQFAVNAAGLLGF